MKLKLLLLPLCLVVFSSHLLCQSLLPTSYQNIDTIKIHYPTNTAPDTCCPCIAQFYNENNILTKEQVVCMQFEVGWVKEYYPNGNLKLSGQYEENHSGNWYHLVETGKCCFEEGMWTYFDETGDTLYNEYWQGGFFLQQIPEQPKTEIWFTDLHINNEHHPFFEMRSFEQLRSLEIVLYYKNSHSDSVNIKIRFEIISPDQNHFIHTFTPDNFKKINVKKLLKKAGIAPADYSISEGAIDLYPGDIETRYFIKVLNNGILIADHEIYLYP